MDSTLKVTISVLFM